LRADVQSGALLFFSLLLALLPDVWLFLWPDFCPFFCLFVCQHIACFFARVSGWALPALRPVLQPFFRLVPAPLLAS